jgi:hypothetical protein
MRPADIRRLELLLVAGSIAGLLIWAAADLREWAQLTFRAPVAVQTPGLRGCRAPDDGEQLVILVVKRDDGVAFRCNYVVSRGQHRQAARGLQL